MDFKFILYIILLIIILIAGILVYFIPTIVADKRGHRHLIPIMAVNIVVGWTIVGWGFVLFWALTDANENEKETEKYYAQKGKLNFSPAEEITRYKALLDQGILTQEEFDEKKKQLLNL